MNHSFTRPSPIQLKLDFTLGPDADISTRLIDFLRSEPSPADVARELVLQFLAPFDARAAIISLIETDATLRIVGAFGVSECTVQPGYCSVWDDFPSAAAVRRREPVLGLSAEQCAHQFPVLRELGLPDFAAVAVPLLTSLSTVGAMSVYFGTEGPPVLAASQTLQAIADVYVLFLASRPTAHSATDMCVAADGRPPTSRIEASRAATPVAKRDLTRRQHAVLRLLSEELTYDQIAGRIGYSHSTVREELMHVYRLLGVNSRRDAVREAIRRGILPSVEEGSTEMSLDVYPVRSN